MRCVPGSVNIPVAKFPVSTATGAEPDPSKVASDFVEAFNKLLGNADYASLSKLFVDEGYWRDHLALSWSFRTAHSPPRIHELVESWVGSKDGFRLKHIEIDDSTALRKPQAAPVDPAGTVPGVQFFLKLSTAVGAGVGVVRLVQQDSNWKIFTLFTGLEEIRGHEEAINGRRPKGVEHGGTAGRKNWAERRAEESSFSVAEPAVLIVGEFFVRRWNQWLIL